MYAIYLTPWHMALYLMCYSVESCFFNLWDYHLGSDGHHECTLVSLLLDFLKVIIEIFFRQVNGSLSELTSQFVDTGMGLERLVAVLQQHKSNYRTDLFLPVMKQIENVRIIYTRMKDYYKRYLTLVNAG